jgi:hypothetical protein
MIQSWAYCIPCQNSLHTNVLARSREPEGLRPRPDHRVKGPSGENTNIASDLGGTNISTPSPSIEVLLTWTCSTSTTQLTNIPQRALDQRSPREHPHLGPDRRPSPLSSEITPTPRETSDAPSTGFTKMSNVIRGLNGGEER